MVLRKTQQSSKKKILKKQWLRGFFPVELLDALKRQQILSIGSLIIFFLLISPIIIWLSYQPDSVQNPFIAVAKFNAFMAISTLSINYFLSTRMEGLEYVFNGLDRMYRVHKVVGRLALIFILLHPLFLILSVYPNTNVILTYLLPLGPITIATGVISVYIFLILLALTVALNIPYHWWHNSHKLFGIVLLLAGFHAVFAGSDIGQYPLLRFWIIFLVTLGIISWLYMLLFYKILGPKYPVIIDHVSHLPSVTEIFFQKPKGFSFQPGQFLFIRFPKFEGYKELFPFSISSDSTQKQMRISVKRSGDFTTEKLPQVKKGEKAIIMGPYGTFGKQYLQHKKDMIWIAGGIGITPFLSLAKHESHHPSDRKIILIWAIKNRKDAFHDEEIKKEVQKNPNVQYIPWISDEKGRISTTDVMNIIEKKVNIRKVKILMCGPSAMMYSLSHGFHTNGVSYHNIIFEDFNMLD